MKTIILPIDKNETLDTVRTAILRGDVVCFPTDTVYGIGCSLFQAKAIRLLYEVKERSQLKAIPVLIGDMTQLPLITTQITQTAQKLTDSFWPGALTIIFNKSSMVPDVLTPYPTVGVRMPDHPWLLSLLIEVGPMAVTSANITGHKDSTNAHEALIQLKNRIPIIVNGGQSTGGTASTVVDCMTEPFKLLRQGSISQAQIESILN